MKPWILATIAFAIPAVMAEADDVSDHRPRVIVSSDIGGTDADDFQSMIHYLMVSDRFETEGLIASPYGDGRQSDILRMIDLYEQDYPGLKSHSAAFPEPDALRTVTKQGATERAPGKGWSTPTEGSRWIVERARRHDARPLWVLVWGGIDDLAQALHDDPAIAPKLRVYFIGGPNKKWSADAYRYIAATFPELWMIEANATYRGWFTGGDQGGDLGNAAFHEARIRGRGALGREFGNHYGGVIKMGDTPSVAYLMNGDPDDPAGPSWGGSFTPMRHSPRRIFERATTAADTVPTFGLIEWVLRGPDRGPAVDEPCLWLTIAGQSFEGYDEGSGIYRVRFAPKAAGEWEYEIRSGVEGLADRAGAFTSIDPWPGPPAADDLTGLSRWWTDSNDPAMRDGAHWGAGSVSRWREAFLGDWAERWEWLEKNIE